MSVNAAKVLDRLVGGALLRALGPVRAVTDLWRDDRPLVRVREIAAVKLWGIGNAALLLPVLTALKERYPGARLTVVTLADNRALLEPVADRVLAVHMRPMGRAVLDMTRALAMLRQDRPDLGLDFEQYVRSSQALLHLAGARQIIGFETAGQERAGLADVRVPYDNRRHTGQSFLDLARAAGVRQRTYHPGGLVPQPDDVRWADEWCARAGAGDERPLVLMHPGSGDNFPGRRWPPRRFGLLARTVHDAGGLVAVTGGRREQRLAREVREASTRPIFDMAGRLTLGRFVALIARAAFLVCNDTGPVHIASALRVPVLGLYGPNSPVLYGPLGAGSVAFYDAPPCSPCITNFNYKTSRCRNPVCIQAIRVDAVAREALHLLWARRQEATA